MGEELGCLFAGQFGYNYDIQVIIDTAEACLNAKHKIRFYLAGDGYKFDDIKKQVEEKKLSNVELLGWLSVPELEAVSKKCSVGLNSYTSRATQSLPTKIFYYMRLGLYILNSLENEASDFVEEEAIGQNYKAESKESLLDSLLKLYQDQEKLMIACQSNLIKFDKRFTFNAIYESMCKIIKEQL